VALPDRFTRKELLAPIALRYALAPVCLLLAVALHLSPAGAMFHPTGLFTIAVIGAAWFGGAGPGFLAALIATFTLPQLIPMSYPLLVGIFDLPRLVTFSFVGLAVGYGSSLRAGKLRKQERYARAIEASDDGFWDWFSATDTIYASPRLLEIYGLAPATTFKGPDDIVGSIAFHPEDRPQMARALAEHFAGKTTRLDLQMRFTRDGETRWAHIIGVAQRNSSGAMVRWTGTVRDVTQQKRVEEALRGSEDRFARAVAGSSHGVWDIDLVGRTVYFSPRTRELCGLPPGPEVVPLEGWFENLPLHPEDLPRRFAAVNAHLRGDVPAYDGEFRFLQPDGVYRWRHLHGVCVRDADGKPLRMAGSMVDVDARRRVEDALRASDQRYELAMAASESGYWDWHIPTGQYFVSPRAYELGGYSPGTTWISREEFTASTNMHPEDARKWEAARDELFAGTGDRLAMEVRYIVRGETRWHMLQAICRRDKDSKVIRWIGSATDITEKKRAADELRRSEAFLAEGQRLSRTGSFSWRVATGEITWSEQLYRIFRLDPGVPVTLELMRSRVHPEDVTSFNDAMDLARSRDDFDLEHRLLMPDLSIKYLHVIAHATRDKDGRPEYMGAVQDVTERRLSEEALAKARSDLARVARVTSFGALTASIAHEVNQPLTGIITNASTCLRLLAADPPKIQVALEAARRTIRDGHRASDVINRLRALFGNKDTAAVPVDLTDAARELLALVSSDLQRNRVMLRTELADDLPPVNGDRVQLQQVILNLIRNGSDAMSGVEDRPRHLIVRTELDDEDSVRLTVQDAGVGFGTGAMERLFDPFYTTKSDGMGIGLSVSRFIIERHRGRLWAAPNGDAPGATVCFSIPRAANGLTVLSTSHEVCDEHSPTDSNADKLHSLA
jgi:PAS domain S-box-containing protein